jgi:hypothetical protein
LPVARIEDLECPAKFLDTAQVMAADVGRNVWDINSEALRPSASYETTNWAMDLSSIQNPGCRLQLNSQGPFAPNGKFQ